jgi:hypothetical protein
MDEKPFLDINLLDLDGNMFVQLEKLTKEFCNYSAKLKWGSRFFA